MLASGPVTYQSPFALWCFSPHLLTKTRNWVFLSMNSKCSFNMVKYRKKTQPIDILQALGALQCIGSNKAELV